MYTKFQVALLYFPDMIDNPDSALTKLRRKIENKPGLLQRLVDETGYRIYSKGFDLDQLNMIIQALGRPKGLQTTTNDSKRQNRTDVRE